MSRVRLVQGVGQRPYFGNTGNTGKNNCQDNMLGQYEHWYLETVQQPIHSLGNVPGAAPPPKQPQAAAAAQSLSHC
jgi:hypothetical protein